MGVFSIHGIFSSFFLFPWGDGKGEGGICHALFFLGLFPFVKSIVKGTPRVMNLLHKAHVLRKKKKRGK